MLSLPTGQTHLIGKAQAPDVVGAEKAGDENGPVVLEADQASVEQCIDVGRQEKAVVGIKPLPVGRLCPGLDMRGPQQLQMINTG